jgi:hypothetical protein
MHHKRTGCNKIAGSQNAYFMCQYNSALREYGSPDTKSFFPSVFNLNSVDIRNELFVLGKPVTNGRLHT